MSLTFIGAKSVAISRKLVCFREDSTDFDRTQGECVMAVYTCVHCLLNAQQVWSHQPQSLISMTRARGGCFSQPSTTHTPQRCFHPETSVGTVLQFYFPKRESKLTGERQGASRQRGQGEMAVQVTWAGTARTGQEQAGSTPRKQSGK